MIKTLEGRPLADIPNIEGYQFLGYFKDGTWRMCTVYKNTNGYYTVNNFSNLLSWKKVNLK